MGSVEVRERGEAWRYLAEHHVLSLLELLSL